MGRSIACPTLGLAAHRTARAVCLGTSQVMEELEDPVIAFFSAVGEHLEEAIRNFKTGDSETAIPAMERAVELCEEHPTYAVLQYAELGSSLQKVVLGCISNAIAKGRSGAKMTELRTRIAAIDEFGLH